MSKKKKPIFVRSSKKKGDSFGHTEDSRFSTTSGTSESPAPKGNVRRPSSYSPMGDLHNYLGHMKNPKFHDQGHNTTYPGFKKTGGGRGGY